MSSDLVPNGEATFGVPGLRSGRVGVIEWPTHMSFEEWDDLGVVACEARDWTAWFTGDWLDFGYERWKKDDRYAQARALTGRSYGGLRNLRWVSKRFPLHRRREALTWSHHRLVAKLDEAEQDEWLDRAEARGWSVDLLDSALVDAGLVTSGDKRDGEAEVVAVVRELQRQHPTLDADRINRIVRAGIEREAAAVEIPTMAEQLQVGASLRAVAAVIVAMPRDDHGRVCLDRNMLEQLRAAIGEDT